MKRDLYAGGERDAVRCRTAGLEGLEEILALAPADPSSRAHPPSPTRQARAASLASTSTLPPPPSSTPTAPIPRRRHSHQPPTSAPLVSPSLSRAALPPPTSCSSSSTPARSRAASVVKRKPVPRVALDEGVDLFTPLAWERAARPPSPALAPERRIDERVRQLSMDDGVAGERGLGLRIRVGSADGSSGGRHEHSLPPASPSSSIPVSPVTSRATSSSLSRSTTTSSATSYSNVSSPRPFALVRRQSQRSSSARDVLFGARRGHSDLEVDDALVDAWMDLIAGHDDEAVVRRRASVARVVPPSSPPPPAPRAAGMQGAPRPYELDTLAQIVTTLAPLVYATMSPRSPSPTSAYPPDFSLLANPPPSPPSAPSATRHSFSTHASGVSAPPLAVERPAPPLEPQAGAPQRLSLLAASLHDSDATSDDYHSAVESSAASARSTYVDAPVAATPTLRERRLCKRSSSSLRASEPRRLVVDAAAGACAASPSPLSPSSPASPAQPEQKRRLLSSDKPLPARPPKSAARRLSTDASRLLGAGSDSSARATSAASALSRADEREAVGRYVLLGRTSSTSSASVESCDAKVLAHGHSVHPSLTVL
ncbi:hypothetical protein JCM9279_001705 [Rhodotorula babjevae]